MESICILGTSLVINSTAIICSNINSIIAYWRRWTYSHEYMLMLKNYSLDAQYKIIKFIAQLCHTRATTYTTIKYQNENILLPYNDECCDIHINDNIGYCHIETIYYNLNIVAIKFTTNGKKTFGSYFPTYNEFEQLLELINHIVS